MSACTIEGCIRDSRARGMCRAHYLRWYKGQSIDDVPLVEMRRQYCTVDGCSEPRQGQGLCGKHYARLRRNGTTDDPAPRPRTCSIEGCDRKHRAKGFCSSHYPRPPSSSKRRQNLARLYRMSESEWDARFESQGRCCPVCRTSAASKWTVHHDHRCCAGGRSCGRCVIAILCNRCNLAIGALGDDADRLERAAALMRSSADRLGLTEGVTA